MSTQNYVYIPIVALIPFCLLLLLFFFFNFSTRLQSQICGLCIHVYMRGCIYTYIYVYVCGSISVGFSFCPNSKWVKEEFKYLRCCARATGAMAPSWLINSGAQPYVPWKLNKEGGKKKKKFFFNKIKERKIFFNFILALSSLNLLYVNLLF